MLRKYIVEPVGSCIAGKVRHSPDEAWEQDGLSAAARALVDKCLEDVDVDNIVDYHTHVLTGQHEVSGGYANPKYFSFFSSPTEHMKFLGVKSAAGITHESQMDRQYVDRLVSLVQSFSPKRDGSHPRCRLLALDQVYDEHGIPQPEKTSFYIPNDYVFSICREYPSLFEPVVSVHPYRSDALVELDRWASCGVRMIKWLPNCMRIDPASDLCHDFYRRVTANNMILLTHVGVEHSLTAGGTNQVLGNPLRLRRPLAMGCKVIAAHCASAGVDIDFESPKPSAKESFKLFRRLMDDPRYLGLLFADISSVGAVGRGGKTLSKILARRDWHSRLVYGSDYPLPAVAVNTMTSVHYVQGYITNAERKALNEIYQYNPLLFDFAMKRSLKHPKTGATLPPSVFQRNDDLEPDKELWKDRYMRSIELSRR